MNASGRLSQDRAAQWMDKFQLLAHELSTDLFRTWHACDDFVPNHAEDLDDEDLGPRCLSLNGIEAEVKNLAELKARLDAVTSLCDGYRQSVSSPIFVSALLHNLLTFSCGVARLPCRPPADGLGSRQ